LGAFEFSGNYTHNLDVKGRATIPAVFREAFSDGFAVGLNNDFNAIALYPPEKWREIGARLDRIPDSDQRGMSYVRLIKAFSYPGQTLDGQNRVLIPQALRQQTGMEKAIRFVGVGRYLEIWDEERFIRQYLSARENVEELMQYVNDRYFGAPTAAE
jgi:MraZ protein